MPLAAVGWAAERLITAELNWSNMSWTKLSRNELNRVELNWAEPSWAEPSWAELSWTELSWIVVNRAWLSWAELSLIEPRYQQSAADHTMVRPWTISDTRWYDRLQHRSVEVGPGRGLDDGAHVPMATSWQHRTGWQSRRGEDVLGLARGRWNDGRYSALGARRTNLHPRAQCDSLAISHSNST